jgi:hypothetical protein
MASVAAGGNITLHSDREPTSAMLRLVVRDWDGDVPAVIAVAVGPEGGARVVIGEGAEVVKSGGGLGVFEAMMDILLVLMRGLDVGDNVVLLPVEFGKYLALLGIAVEVGAQSPVTGIAGGLDEGVDVGGLMMEEVDKPGGQGCKGTAVGVARGGIDGAEVLFVIVRCSQGSDGVSGVSWALTKEGGHEEASPSSWDGEVGGDVVIGDVAIGSCICKESHSQLILLHTDINKIKEPMTLL